MTSRQEPLAPWTIYVVGVQVEGVLHLLRDDAGMMLTALPESRKARSSCDSTRMGRRVAPQGEVSSGCRGDVTYTPVLAFLTSGQGECLKNDVMWTRTLVLVPWFDARGRGMSGNPSSYVPGTGGRARTSGNGILWSCGRREGTRSTRPWVGSMRPEGRVSHSAGEVVGGQDNVRGSVWSDHKGARRWFSWGFVMAACVLVCCHVRLGSGTPGVCDGLQGTYRVVGWVSWRMTRYQCLR